MLDTEKQMRFAQCCSDAAFGYAAAASAAYGSLAATTVEFWARQTGHEPEQPRSWYRHPDAPQAFAMPTVPATAVQPWFGLLPAAGGAVPVPFSWSPDVRADPIGAMMQAWRAAPLAVMEFWRIERAPVAWPMMLVMLAAGLPRNVAVPTAEANAAALDAVTIAGEAVEEVFSSYRSDSGHATAHIVTMPARGRGGAALAPLMMMAMPLAVLPWLSQGLDAVRW